MPITKKVKLEDINFDSYVSFQNTITVTNDNDTSEFDIYKGDAISLIHLFIEHFDLTLTDIILSNNKT